MAEPKDIDSHITLEIGDANLTSDDLRKSIDAFDGLLKTVTKSVCPGSSVDWIIRPKTGSLLIGANAATDPGTVEQIKALAHDSLEGKLPSIHSDEVVRHIRVLSNIKNVHLWVGRESREITQEVYATLKAACRPAYIAPGSVEGRLSVLSDRSALAIYEPVWNKRIECNVSDALLEGMRHLWRKRVTAYGMVHYRSDGFPASIDAQSVQPFADDDALPSSADVLGILPME